MATALGGGLLVAFWTLYFLANESLGLVPADHVHFEESFIVADTVLASLLFATSWSLRRRLASGPFVLAMAASMTLYLGILDATFYAKSGIFWPFSSAALGAVLITLVCVVGGLYGLRSAWCFWRWT